MILSQLLVLDGTQLWVWPRAGSVVTLPVAEAMDLISSATLGGSAVLREHGRFNLG